MNIIKNQNGVTFLRASHIFVLIIIALCKTTQINAQPEIRPYAPVNQKLFDEILMMDQVFFDAFNSCDLTKQDAIYADEIEFFHDKDGLSTSKEEMMAKTKSNVCGKVTRELVKGSVEVYPIHNYGAVQIGFHKFYNNQEPDQVSPPFKFIIMWSNKGGSWQMTKVISLH